VSLPVCFLSSSTVQCHFVTSLSTVNFNYNLHILYAYSTCYMQTVTGAIDTRKIHADCNRCYRHEEDTLQDTRQTVWDNA